MTFKHNQIHRNRIPRARAVVTTWAAYEQRFVQRDDLRFWTSE